MTVPYQYLLENEYRQVINGKSMHRFGDVAINFKNEIEFTSNIMKIIFIEYLKKYWIGVNFINFINFINLDNLDNFNLPRNSPSACGGDE